MKIIAKTIIGKEFMYNARTARRVSDKSADKICAIVNQHKAILGAGENEIFRVYEIDRYCAAYDYAMIQSFTIRNGVVTARNH